MRNLWNDLRYALRTLGKSPGFAVIGIITLALGMAVNTTIFSVINGILLRPLSPGGAAVRLKIWRVPSVAL